MINYLLVLILSGFISFEDFLLKWLPGYDYLRYFSEIFIYMAFFCCLLQKIRYRNKLIKTPLDTPIIIFFEVIIISILFNQVLTFGALIKVKAIIRYIFLYYLIVNLNLNQDRVKKIINIILGAGIIQVLFGIVQKLSAGRLNDFLSPPQTQVEILGVKKNFVLFTTGREPGSIYGAAGDTITYAVFLNIILIIILTKLYFHLKSSEGNNRQKNLLYFGFILAIFVCLIFSYSRAAVISASIAFLFYCQLYLGRKKTLGLSLIGLGFIVMLILAASLLRDIDFGDFFVRFRNPIQNLTVLFNPKFLFEQSQVQRLGVFLEVSPIILKNKLLFGYGPDNNLTVQSINADSAQILTYDWLPDYIIDAYWVGLLAYFGVIGLIVFIWLLWSIYHNASIIYKRSKVQITEELALIVMNLIINTVILTFFNNVVEFRIYSFYLWLFPALMFNLYYQELNQSRSKDENLL